MTLGSTASIAPRLPEPRGPLSALLVDRWRGPSRALTGTPAIRADDPLGDDALVGHRAAFEMTSVPPMRRDAATVDRLGLPASARRFYDVHVSADAYHELVAFDGLIGGLAQSEPRLGPEVIFGAKARMAVQGRFTAHLLDAWTAGRSSLRRPVV